MRPQRSAGRDRAGEQRILRGGRKTGIPSPRVVRQGSGSHEVPGAVPMGSAVRRAMAPQEVPGAMPIGPAVRRAMGPLEGRISRSYRRIFVDLDALVALVRDWAPASRILEVGCGEGELTERLALAYPEAALTGIDITPRAGRLFRGDRRRVDFRQCSVSDFARVHPAEFDLVLIADVLHHVPPPLHDALLADAKMALAPGGRFVLKDWERGRSPIHLLTWFSDRCITGDRVRYGTATDHRALVERIFGVGSIVREARVGPWRNNFLFLARGEVPSPAAGPGDPR